MHHFLSLASFQYFSIISILYEIKPAIPYIRFHPPCLLLQLTLENLTNLALKDSNLTLYGILELNKIKYPVASGGPHPQTPCFRDTILRLAPPLYIHS